MRTVLTACFVSMMSNLAVASEPKSFLLTSPAGGVELWTSGVQEVPFSELRRRTFPEPIRATKVYCSENWAGVIAELGGTYYALNGTARGRDITVMGVSGKTKVEDGSGEGAPFQNYDEEPTDMIRAALSQCGH